MLLAPLVIPVKVDAVRPVYDICSVPTNKVPDVGKPAVVSTVRAAPVAGTLAVTPESFISVSGCLIFLLR